jgi:Phosphatidylethanolamine-binding protein
VSESKKKMFKFLIFVSFLKFTQPCEYIFPQEFDGCDFDSLYLVNGYSGFTLAEDNCGLEVDKSTFNEQPYVFYPDANEDLKYTLIMIDSDNEQDFLHWLVVDIDGISLKHGTDEFYGRIEAGSKKTQKNKNEFELNLCAQLMNNNLFQLICLLIHRKSHAFIAIRSTYSNKHLIHLSSHCYQSRDRNSV